ncbi:MAG: hypothetical protein ABIG84_02350 [archaeon]
MAYKKIAAENVLLIPTKSRYELELERWGTVDSTRRRFRSDVAWNNVIDGHYAQKENLAKIKDVSVFGESQFVDRSFLTDEAIKNNDLFVFLGGDNHFTWCAQKILKYVQETGDDEKYVVGVVLDPRKSFGGLLYYGIDQFLGNVENILGGDYRIENWTTLEANVMNENGDCMPYPAVGDYFVGEHDRTLMSRNELYLGGDKLDVPDKSSGILFVAGAGSDDGSWYDNVHNIMFGSPDRFGKEEDFARVVLTENKSKTKFTLDKGQILVVDSYNDDNGKIKPDSHNDHSVDLSLGHRAEIKISDMKLKVVNSSDYQIQR